MWSKDGTIRGEEVPRRPKDVPSAPNIVYKGKGWERWKVFLGVQSKSQLSKKAGKGQKGQSKARVKDKKVPETKRKRENGEGELEKGDTKRRRGLEESLALSADAYASAHI